MRAQAGRGVCACRKMILQRNTENIYIYIYIFRFYKDFTTKQILKNVENIFPEKIFFNKTNIIFSKKLIQTHTCLVFTKALLRNMK